MEQIDLEKILSPEWGKADGDFVTSQYGAQLNFISHQADTVVVTLSQVYPGLQWLWSIDQHDFQVVLPIDNQLRLDLPAGTHRHQIVLQNLTMGQIALWQQGVRLMSVTSQHALEPVGFQKPYVTFVGDSITAGECMDGLQHHPELSFPQLVAQALQRPLARIAYGGTGLTSHAPFQEPSAIEALWKIGETIARPRVQTDLVVVNYGLNDANYGANRQEFAFGLRVYLLELIKRFHQARFILLTPYNGAFVDIFKTEAQRFDCFEVVDTSDWQVYVTGRHPNLVEHQRAAHNILNLLEV
ncbi:GDSL-type esterase/lipase family protein [Convivina praedatoris]|uniref:SGNH hydrolase-type esterase domain-containing protein n=1 Tax=Convivina praedatoris TaxID=2880963 RepID=A0ABM9D263_9LACO|nr:GDSL-type esterase/lipase family protein [Convivina sp. LMG 32447]CAH1853403.1 hypothetical protein R077815_00827 [Convivina sp. LMG 32447]CAH1854781.1 hypothetical protein LMG032447_00941 [Convivina sp. LMG 32447]CAH1855023.1 hypothetical protein R078138_01039 [Convivina sp. LMG 32447]